MFLSRNSNECLHFVEEELIIKPVKLEGVKLLLSIKHTGKSLIVTLENVNEASAELKASVKKYITEWLDLDSDIELFYKIAEKDKVLKDVIKSYRGLRIIGMPDLFEALVWSVTGQQINLNFAYSLKSKFVEAYGERFSYNGTEYFLFPEPSIIAKLKPEELKKLQFTGKKSEYIIGIAQLMERGELSKEALLAEWDINGVKNTLIKIRGIGEWSADYVMMKCLRIRSAFPFADVGFHNAVKNILKLEMKPSIDELKKMAVKWKGWEAYAVFYLWRSLIK